MVPDPILTGDLDGAVAYQLRRAQEASFAAFAHRVGPARIWPGWYALLSIIGANPGINQTDLSRASGRDKSTLTAALRALDKEALIERARDEADRRSFRVTLSGKGEEHLRALAEHAHAHDRMLDAIAGDDRAVLLRLLQRIADELQPSPIGA